MGEELGFPAEWERNGKEDHLCRPRVVVSERNCALRHSCHVTQKAKMLWDARDSRAGAVIDIMLGFIHCYSSTPL